MIPFGPHTHWTGYLDSFKNHVEKPHQGDRFPRGEHQFFQEDHPAVKKTEKSTHSSRNRIHDAGMMLG